MNQFIPTDEQLFDYFLKQIDPSLIKSVAAYLDEHPELAKKYEEFAQIQITFENIVLHSPADEVLQKVLAQAGQELQPNKKNTLAHWLFWRRSLTYGAVLGATLFLTFHLINPGEETLLPTYEANLTTLKPSANAAIKKVTSEDQYTVKADVLNELKAKRANKEMAQSLYQKALELFEQKEFSKAEKMFAELLEIAPDFDKKVQLYSYWIKTLNQLGKNEDAEEKQHILESLQKDSEAF